MSAPRGVIRTLYITPAMQMGNKRKYVSSWEGHRRATDTMQYIHNMDSSELSHNFFNYHQPDFYLQSIKDAWYGSLANNWFKNCSSTQLISKRIPTIRTTNNRVVLLIMRTIEVGIKNMVKGYQLSICFYLNLKIFTMTETKLSIVQRFYMSLGTPHWTRFPTFLQE